MSKTDAARGLILAADEGEAWWFLGTLAVIKVGGEQTDGRYALFEFVLPKDASPPLHSHPQGETFILREGVMKFWVGGVVHQCSAGSIAYAPPGVPHSFLVESETASGLVLSTPAGIERMVRLLGDPASERRLPDDDLFPSEEKINDVYAAVQVTVHGPSPLRPAA